MHWSTLLITISIRFLFQKCNLEEQKKIVEILKEIKNLGIIYCVNANDLQSKKRAAFKPLFLRK